MAIQCAVIYVQGIHRVGRGPTLDRFAAGLATSLGPDFVKEERVETLQHRDVMLEARRIHCRREDGWAPAIELIEADYYDIFRQLDDDPIYVKLAYRLRLVLGNIRLLGRLGNRSEGKGGDGHAGDRLSLQRLYLLTLVVLVVLSPVAILVAVYLLAHDIAGSLAKIGGESLGFGGTFAMLVSILALLKIFWTSLMPKGVRDLIAMLSRDPLRMLEYLTERTPSERSVAARILRRLDAAYETVRRRHPDARIVVVAYSFGTIMAYDWLLPRSAPDLPAGRRPADRPICALVTLGFPIQMVTTFWPDYFDRAFPDPLPFLNWHNLTLVDDLVGSVLPKSGPLARMLDTERAAGRLTLVERAETLPDGVIKRTGMAALDGVSAHAAYFGFGDSDRAPVLSRCTEAIRPFV